MISTIINYAKYLLGVFLAKVALLVLEAYDGKANAIDVGA